MLETGFHVYWRILDGADVNRQFVKLHFQGEDEAVEKRFTAQNLYTGEPFVFMMDSKVNNMSDCSLQLSFKVTIVYDCNNLLNY